MPAYQRKQMKFGLSGINQTRPIDLVPEFQYPWAINIRSYKQGVIQPRPGLTILCNDVPATTPPHYADQTTDYVHTIVHVNDSNPNSSGGTTRYFGFNTYFYSLDLTGPPAASTEIDTGYSGNPLSYVMVSPADNPAPFLYVGDSAKMRKYSSSYLSGGVIYPYNVGLPEVNAAAPNPTLSAGGLTGSYSWRWRMRDRETGSISPPGPPAFDDILLGTLFTLAAQQAQFTSPAAPSDAGAITLVFDLFRFGGAVNQWKFIGSVPASTSITDNTSDEIALASQDLIVDGNLVSYRPFVTLDDPKSGTCDTTAAGVGSPDGSLIHRTGGNNINQQWIHGTEIIINEKVCTIRRIVSTTDFYINEDAGTNSGVSWSVAGALKYGTPLPHIWGPYGSGFTGLYIFGVGDSSNPGTVYWTIGNNPDGHTITGNLQITNSSEPLVNGCVYNGRCYVWSADRRWEISPDLSNAGQFVAQEIPGSRGLHAPWGLAVGDYIYFKSRDGIFRTTGIGDESLTDDSLYPMFPHDSQPATGLVVPDPNTPGASLTAYPPDNNKTIAQRLGYFNRLLYFDYVGTDGHSYSLVYNTVKEFSGWTIDDYKADGYASRVVEVDYGTSLAPGGTNHIIGIGSILYIFTGNDDYGYTITWQLMTSAWDAGDERTKKIWGDLVVSAVANGRTITAKVLGSNNTAVLVSASLDSTTSGRVENIVSLNNGTIDPLSRTLGLWLSGDTGVGGAAASSEIYFWEPSYVGKPEFIAKRATDWTDDGLVGTKFLMGCLIEANVSIAASGSDLRVDAALNNYVNAASHSFAVADVGCIVQIVGGTGWTQGTYVIEASGAGVARLDHSPAAPGATGGQYIMGGNRSVQVQYDGGSVAANLTISAPGQTEQVYAIVPPVACREMRLVPNDSLTCQLFNVRWIWAAYPEYAPLNTDYALESWPSGKYVRGVAIEGDSQGVDTNLQVIYDGGTVAATITVNQSGKTLMTYAFATPFVANEIKLIPLGSWRRHSVRWILDDYPDYAALITSWSDGNRVGCKFIRGAIIKADTNNATVNVTLSADGANTSYSYALKLAGQIEFPISFVPPLTAYLMRWIPDGPWRHWATQWLYDEYPDLTTAQTAWLDLEHHGAKFLQGVRIACDTGGLPVRFDVLGTNNVVIYTTDALTAAGKQTIPVSFPPYITYVVALRPKSPARIWTEHTEWVWEPAPDIAVNWTTQETDHDLPGWHSLRDCWIAYQSAPGGSAPETLQIDSSEGTELYSLPNSGGQYSRVYQVLKPQKARWHRYKLLSTVGARLFKRDTIVRVKPFNGMQAAFIQAQPFGDYTRVHGATI